MLTVKGIFKTLLGVIVITVVGTLIVEMANTSTTTHYVKMTMDTALNTACQYFSQESYKTDGTARGNMPNIVSKDGGIVSGKFYTGNSEDEIFNNLYRNSSEFRSFANAHKGTWSYLGEFFSSSNALLRENNVTPSNMGITYLDRKSVAQIARWNLTKLLANGYTENIVGSGNNLHVNYKGFQVYTNQLNITDIKYTEIPMTDYRFKEFTHLEASNLGVDLSNTEVSTICLAQVTYTVPISYEGITPIAKIYRYVSTHRVEGLDEGRDTSDLGMYFNTAATNFDSTYASSITPVQGSILFYIVR